MMTHDLTSTYWNDRYLNDEFTWDMGAVSEPLKTYFDQLQNKELRILIPGAGNSYEAEYLWSLGFKQVTVLDFAAAPLQNIKNRIPDFPAEQLIQEDFFKHEGQYDLMVEQTFFCALDPVLRKNYVSHTHELLKPGAKLVGVLFNDALNTDKPPFGGFKEDYEPLFFPLFKKICFEPCYNSVKPRAGRELFMILRKP
jgi:hypothetical protein